MNLNGTVEHLRQERIRRGMTLDEVARRGGWANEAGPRRVETPGANPTLRSIQRYAKAIGMSCHLSLETATPHVLSFFGHAGGISKTSCVRDIGYVLAQEGFKVLLIDLDPQANLTAWLGFEPHEVTLQETIEPVLMKPQTQTTPTRPKSIYGINLIPSTLDLALTDRLMVTNTASVVRLKKYIDNLTGYDFILIDCPPALNLLSAAGVIASSHVVVPAPTKRKGIEAIDTVIRMVAEYQESNPELAILAFVPTQYDSRNNHDNAVLMNYRENLTDIAKVCSPLHWRSAIYNDATLQMQPVPLYEPNGKSDEEIRTVTAELLEALGVLINV